MELITSFYTSKNVERNLELEKALIKNIESEFILRIHLFVDDDVSRDTLQTHVSFQSDKIVIARMGPQPLYSDLFAYANTLPVGTVCMISNSDIWLKSVVDAKLLDYMRSQPTLMYSLTRYENDMTCPLIDMYRGSHDAFIFKSPIANSIFKHIKFPQNVWGSENVLLYEINKLKYTILNPCHQLKIVHEHHSNERNPGRKRINYGDHDGDGVFRRRSHLSPPIII